MIARIRGTVVYKGEGFVIIEAGNIGYKVKIPDKVCLEIPLNQDMILYTELIVRQDLLQLYGFLTIMEVEMFRLLITVSHIGPQTGLSILSRLTIGDIYTAITCQKAELLSKVPGLGKKGAERIILELKNKISDFQQSADNISYTPLPKQDALLALVSLGYSDEEAQRALLAVHEEKISNNSSDMVKEALIHLRKKK